MKIHSQHLESHVTSAFRNRHIDEETKDKLIAVAREITSLRALADRKEINEFWKVLEREK